MDPNACVNPTHDHEPTKAKVIIRIVQLLSPRQRLWAVYRDEEAVTKVVLEPVEAWGLLESGNFAVPMVASPIGLVPADGRYDDDERRMAYLGMAGSKEETRAPKAVAVAAFELLDEQQTEATPPTDEPSTDDSMEVSVSR